MKNYIIKIFLNLKHILDKIKHNKILLYTLCTCILVLFCLALNFAFSSFTHTASNIAANIKVKDMTFSMSINGTATTLLTASSNNITKANIILTSTNSMAAKYELIYHICSNSSCETYINNPAGLTIEYSSRTPDPINGTINAGAAKAMRLVVTNTTSTIYYIKVDVNAGYNYNTLALLNIISEYDEDDVTIAAYIDGTLSTTFPTTRNYSVSVSCTVKGSASNATGTAIWDTTNSKWLLNITGADTGETRCNAYFTFQNDSSGANAPNLATNMIPVIYDNTNDVWTKADVNNKTTTWYDYNNQIWANAVTVTSSTRSAYNSAAAGTQILMSDILGFWVWIPRYEYMYNNLAASYAGGTQSMPGGISIKFISGTNTTSDPNYLIHPAFRNGNTYKCSSNYDLGGWDKELTGFWMGKFETGYATINNGDVVLTSNILVKPDVFSLGGQTTSKKYSTAQNIQTDHGIGTSIDTHMTKNDEWGAVAYLSQSNYGKYGNSAYSGANKEIYVNNAYYSSTTAYIPEKKSNNSIALLDNEIAYEIYYDHYSSGRSAGTYSGNTGSTLDSAKQYGNYEYNNCPASAYGHTSCSESTRISNNTLGTGASTTGNIYGIYDMAGGLDEAVMANYLGTIGTTGFSEMPSQKYWNKYTSNSLVSSCNGCLCYGQAITETNAGGNSGQYQWYNNFMFFVDSSYPQVNRGNSAGASDTSSVGIFSFYAYTVNSSSGFRVSAS